MDTAKDFYTGAVISRTSQEISKHSYRAGFQRLYASFYAWLLRLMPTERQRLLAVTIWLADSADWLLWHSI